MEVPKPTYRQILKKSWWITWHNPILWFFGLFAALLGINGEFEILIYGNSNDPLTSSVLGFAEGIIGSGLFTIAGIKGFFITLFSEPVSFFIAIILLMIAFGLVAAASWLVIVSQGAMINGIINIVKTKKAKWSENFKFGITKFWPLLFLNVVVKIIIWALLLILSFWVGLELPGLTTFFIFGFILFIFVSVVVSFIIKYAVCGVVLRGQKVGESLKAAFAIFTKNWLLSLEVAFVLFLIYSVVTFILSAAIYFSLPILVNLSVPYPVFLFLVLAAAFTLSVVVQVLLTIFNWSVWILVYEILISKKAEMLSRIAGGLKKIFS